MALVLLGAGIVPPAGAEHEPLIDLSLGSRHSTDFNADNGTWQASLVPPPPPRPDPLNPSWAHGLLTRPITNPTWEWGEFVANPRPAPANPSWEWGVVPDHDSIPRPINNPSWQWGAPTSGPGFAASGLNVWATNLAGPYNANHCAGVMSPVIDLTGGTAATLTFQHWLHGDASATTGWHGGIVFVTTDGGNTLTRVVPEGDYPPPALGTTARGCLDNQPTGITGYNGPAGATPPPATYNLAEFNLDAFAGQQIQLVWGWGTDGSGLRDGWYLDDVNVTKDSAPFYAEDFESGNGGFTVVGVRPKAVIGPGVANSGEKAWATSLAGPHNDNECAALLSPPIAIPTGATAEVSFMQWRHMQKVSATGTSNDAGRLFVTLDDGQTLERIDTPSPAYDTGALSALSAACLDGVATSALGYSGPSGTAVPGPTYSEVSANLSAYAGSTVRFAIGFGSDGSTARSGWYIDDFTVTIDGVATVEDFEASDGGFTIITTAPAPSNGPGVAASGSRVWGTNINGAHNHNECAGLVSPPIDLTAATEASVSFQQWRHFQRTTTTGTIFDGGRLFVTADGGKTLSRIDNPTPAYDTGTLSLLLAGCLDGSPTTGTNAYGGPVGEALPPATYSEVMADLTPYAGSVVQFVIAVGSDASTARDGWYIDDFTVTIDGLSNTEDFEASDGGFTVMGVRRVGPGAAYSGEHVWATNVLGDYNNNECNALLSPPITLPAEASSASFSFASWRHFERSSATGTAFDAGRLFVTFDGGESFISIDNPTPAYDNGPLHVNTAACLNDTPTSGTAYAGPVGTALPPAVWDTVSADLSEYIGNTIQVVIAFGTDPSGIRNGWYIDDFTVTINDVSTVEDFESGDGGFTVITTSVGPPQPKGWSWGHPTTGPGGIGEDDKMWATNLVGNYGPNECHWVESPPIDLTGIADEVLGELGLDGFPATKATLYWKNWFRGSTLGAGLIQVGHENGTYTPITPNGGYGTATPNAALTACLGVSGSGSAFASLVNAIGDPMVDMSADLTPFLGEMVTLRFLIASTASTATQLGWYIDDVDVELNLYIGMPHLPDLPGFGGGNAPLWTSGGEDSSWAFGVVTQQTSFTGEIQGKVGYKTSLDSFHNAPECSWIQSPPVPGPLFALNPTLVFEHWYRIAGTGVDVAWGGGLVQVSTDGGVTWEYLDLPEYDRPLNYSGGNVACFTGLGAPLDGNVFSGPLSSVGPPTLRTVEADLSDYVGAASIQVRFVFGASSTFAYEGWFLSEVQLGGLDLLITPPI